MRNTAPSPHSQISTPHAPTHQFASTNALSNTYHHHGTSLPPAVSLKEHRYCLCLSCHPLPSSLPLCPSLLNPLPPPPPCVSLTPFQLSTLSPFPPRPLLLPIPHFPHHSLPRWLLLQLIPTCFPINLFQELYYYSLLPITTPLLAPAIPPPSSPH